MTGTQIFDGVLSDPEQYRADVLKLHFRTYDFPQAKFHGIALSGIGQEFTNWLMWQFPNFKPTLTFFRKSPEGQVDPHFIHTDIDMGEHSCILYLNPVPPPGDGTCFWTHKETGAIESSVSHERSEEGKDLRHWVLRERVRARFNRALVFPSSYFHSRAIEGNYGQSDDARLIQVAFGVTTKPAF